MTQQYFRALIVSAFLFSGCAKAEPVNTQTPAFDKFEQIHTMIRDVYCSKDMHETAKVELNEIFASDQADRLTPNAEMSANDVNRRSKLAVIAAKGCLKDKDDYYKAALILQHGTLPEHYLQAVMYANKAVALGHKGAGPLREATIDRYFMALGKKQIFGTQIAAPVFYKEYETDADQEPCLWPVESDFDVMTDYNQGSLEHRKRLQAEIIAKKSQFSECDFPAREALGDLENLLNLKI